jgi:hypothetical protein
MRRIAFLLPTLVAAFAPAAADASPKARALLLGCAQGLVPMDRSAVFEGEMRAQPGTARMQMRFHLRTRASRHPRWGRIGASGLGEWVTSDPGMTHYVFTKRVENLSAPASYRMIIHFRWLDAVGGILAREVAVTRRCRQPDLRPNVRPLSLAVGPGAAPDVLRYVATVGNAGRTGSTPFDVVLGTGGAEHRSAQAVALAAGAESQIAFEAPRCEPGSTVSVRVDTTGAIDERDEVDNTAWWACPA